jgi:hypothetical protein
VHRPERRAALGELWRRAAGAHLERRAPAAAADERLTRLSDAVRYLDQHGSQLPLVLKGRRS